MKKIKEDADKFSEEQDVDKLNRTKKTKKDVDKLIRVKTITQEVKNLIKAREINNQDGDKL